MSDAYMQDVERRVRRAAAFGDDLHAAGAREVSATASAHLDELIRCLDLLQEDAAKLREHIDRDAHTIGELARHNAQLTHRIHELEAECDQWQKKVADNWKEIERLRGMEVRAENERLREERDYWQTMMLSSTTGQEIERLRTIVQRHITEHDCLVCGSELGSEKGRFSDVS